MNAKVMKKIFFENLNSNAKSRRRRGWNPQLAYGMELIAKQSYGIITK